MTDPILGTAEDFTVEVLSEIGSRIRHSALDAVVIDDRRLLQDATELPQLLFYYQAAWCRLNLRAAQAKIRLEEAEANAFVSLRAGSAATGKNMPVDEIKVRITLDPTVQALAREHAELNAKADTVRGILDALRQKGYALQLVSNIRIKEEDWLRRSFTDRFHNHPQRDQIAQSFNLLTGTNILPPA